MRMEKKRHPIEKAALHPRNRHRERYDFEQLMITCPALWPFVRPNAYNDLSVDFADPAAVKMLNRALLQHHYGIVQWDIPPHYLCPPIPGRADYIHHMADLLAVGNAGVIPTGEAITCLDIGVGANAVYPIIGCAEYGWSFIGADIDPVAIANARTIAAANPVLSGKLDLRLQPDARNMFEGILKPDERIDLSICNPPFHASMQDAQAGTLRKLRNLSGKAVRTVTNNFGGQHNELWCQGGERHFVTQMVRESTRFAHQCRWFSTLLSKSDNLKAVQMALQQANAAEVKVIAMGQGNKVSRIVAWTFLRFIDPLSPFSCKFDLQGAGH
jgi:23S rRNA (adenine1618-N6)-methyltransferase